MAYLVAAPDRDAPASLMQAGEQVFIGAFVAQPPSDDSTKTEAAVKATGKVAKGPKR